MVELDQRIHRMERQMIRYTVHTNDKQGIARIFDTLEERWVHIFAGPDYWMMARTAANRLNDGLAA